MKGNHLLEVYNLTKSFPRNGDNLLVLDNISFNLEKGTLLSIVGPSGCGKTTLLEILASLQSQTSGKIIYHNEKQLNSDQYSDLKLIVFQEYNRSMYPFLTVFGNIKFTLDALPIKAKEKNKRIDAAISMTGLSEFSEYYPWELSGGMQQRVALARAIAARPKVLFLDEPFGSLDTQTKYKLEDDVIRLTHEYQLATIYITHDIDSAIYCGQRIIMLSKLPARIKVNIQSELLYPRDQIATRNSSKFLEYRKELYSSLKLEN